MRSVNQTVPDAPISCADAVGLGISITAPGTGRPALPRAMQPLRKGPHPGDVKVARNGTTSSAEAETRAQGRGEAGVEVGFAEVVGHVSHSVDASALLTFIRVASVPGAYQPETARQRFPRSDTTA